MAEWFRRQPAELLYLGSIPSPALWQNPQAIFTYFWVTFAFKEFNIVH
jgi:hypothetical protein